MSDKDIPLHYVCTRDEALMIIQPQKRFWVSNCGCREGRGKCNRSRIDVCLQFHDKTAASGSGMKKISKSEVEEIFKEAEEKHLVTRPFRKEEDKKVTDGICFCCDDCCGYFLNPEEKCDKGKFREKTNLKICNHCGVCEEVCYFGARKMEDGKLILFQENCYGCGLCREVCSEDCIQMISRK